MSIEKFQCPNCAHKLRPTTVFQIKTVHSKIICPTCKQVLLPKLHSRINKYWNYGFAIGLIFSVVPAQLALFLNKSILSALLLGAIIGVNILIISIYLVYKTTSFVKKEL